MSGVRAGAAVRVRRTLDAELITLDEAASLMYDGGHTARTWAITFTPDELAILKGAVTVDTPWDDEVFDACWYQETGRV